ncbi:MAG TPA: M20 family metallopeptidase [Vicinamibacterales bacterium]|nr:M20 family metallopeptidase [Vicinamibacterales bacterium]
MRHVLAFCESEQPWLLETIRALVARESPTHDKSAVDACGRELRQRLEAIGARVTSIAQSVAGDHLRAEFGRGDRQILLLGHFDTVWDVGQLRFMPLAEGDGRLHGPGVFDMKAGIALGMLATRALFERDDAPEAKVVMLWTADEETGSATSRPLIEMEAGRSAAVLVLEPALPGGAVKTSRKGCGSYELVVHGVPAHAGVDPSKGASAIHELARQILRLEALQDPVRGVTLNVGVVSGGTRRNVVAAEARASIDVRVPTMADAVAVDGALRKLAPELPGTRLELRGAIDRPPLERGAAVIHVYEIARDVAAALGKTLDEGATGGGSDGNFTAALGVPTLDGLGAIGDGAHAVHEHVVVSELAWRAALIVGLVDRLVADV